MYYVATYSKFCWPVLQVSRPCCVFRPIPVRQVRSRNAPDCPDTELALSHRSRQGPSDFGERLSPRQDCGTTRLHGMGTSASRYNWTYLATSPMYRRGSSATDPVLGPSRGDGCQLKVPDEVRKSLEARARGLTRGTTAQGYYSCSVPDHGQSSVPRGPHRPWRLYL
jgi:hypothetical protein